MKFSIFLILAICLSALFSPVVFGGELGTKLEMPEYKIIENTVLVGEVEEFKYTLANINVLIPGVLNVQEEDKFNLNNKYNPGIYNNFKEVVQPTSTGELVGVSLHLI